MDFSLRIRKEGECLEEIERLRQTIRDFKCQRFEKDQTISELNKKLNKVEKWKVEIKDLKAQRLEKEKIISELNEQLRKLEIDILEKDRMLGMYEKAQSFKGNTSRLEHEIRGLQGQNFMKDRIICDLNMTLSRMHTDIMQKYWIIGTHHEQVKYLKGQIMTDEMKVQQAKATEEKNKIISELNEKISKLNDQLLEKYQIIGMYEKKLKCLEEKEEKAQRDIQVLKGQILRDDQMIDEMESEQSKASYEKNKIIAELNVDIDKLKHQLLEKDQKIEEYDTKLNCFYANLEQVHKEIAGLKGQKLAAEQVMDKMRCEQVASCLMIEKLRCEQLAAHETIEKMKHNQSEAKKNVEDNLTAASMGLRSQIPVPTTAAGNVPDSLCEKQTLGNQNMQVAGNSNIKIALSIKTEVPSPHTSANCTSNHLQGKGRNKQGAASCNNAENLNQTGSTRYTPQAVNTDVDQENKYKRLKLEDPIDRNDEQTASFNQMISPNSAIRNRKHSSWTASNSDYSDSTDSDDDSCSESNITDLIVNSRCQKLCRKWMSVDEMKRELERDIEVCMNAVCVLYRHKLSNRGALVQFDAMRGSELAEYLMNGDPKHRLRKSVAEVKEDDLVLCRKIAKHHCVKLFVIYSTGEDPLFGYK